MNRLRKLNLKSFLLRLLIVYVALAALWPFVRQTYNRNLGTFTAPLIRIVCFDEVTINRIWLDNHNGTSPSRPHTRQNHPEYAIALL